MANLGHFTQFIDGRCVDSNENYDIVDPSTGCVVATVAKGSIDDAESAVMAARRSYERGSWSQIPPSKRSEIMLRIGQAFNALTDEFVELEIRANGATVRQATGFHIGYCTFHWDYFANLAATYEFETAGATPKWPTLAQAYIRREPLGVVAAITPWNFPLLLSMWKFGPALAAGNSVVVKPDEHTPLTMIRFAELALECGLPPGVLNVVTGDGEMVGAHLAAHPDIDKIAFTGSTSVGKSIASAAVGNLKRLTLELGGKNPIVVLDDADLDLVVDGVLFGSMLYSGQVCLSGSRLIVPDSIHDELVERIVARAGQIVMGDPQDFDTDMGPVISAEQRDRILDYIEIGRGEGATLVCGGGVPEGTGFERGFWVLPTVFTDVTPSMRIAREEIFGPVLSVLRCRDDREAISIANDTDYGLTAAVWSSDIERAMDVARQIRAGTVWINDHHMLSCEVPFGGFKQSGIGRELGPTALDPYTELKHIHLDLSQRLERRAYSALLSTEPPSREEV